MDKACTPTMPELGTSSVDVSLVPHNAVPYLWHEVLPILEEKGERMRSVSSDEEIFSYLCKGGLDLWTAIRNGHLDGVAICGWEIHDRAKYYHVLHVLGDNLHLYLDEGLRKIEKWAYTLGARELIAEGRPGWARILAKRGYSMPTVKLRKNLPRAWGN